MAQVEEYLSKKAFELPVVAKYGILSYAPANYYFGENITVVRKAAKLHILKPGPGCLEIAARRMSSEICSLHRNVREQVEGMVSTNRFFSESLRRLYDTERQQQKPELEEEL